MGRAVRSGAASTCCTGGRRMMLGRVESAARRVGQRDIASFNPRTGAGARSSARNSPRSRTAAGATPSPAATRSGVPNRFATTGMAEVSVPCIAVSNRRMGPPARSICCWIAAISCRRATGSAMLRTCPSAFAQARNKRRSWNTGKVLMQGSVSDGAVCLSAGAVCAFDFRQSFARFGGLLLFEMKKGMP